MSKTFYLSNMSLQAAGFNRRIWSLLEDQGREWGLTCQNLYVVTGPVFKGNIEVVGKNGVPVPSHYYKILYDGNNRKIGLLLPNASSVKSLIQFIVSVDQIKGKWELIFSIA